MKRFLLLVFLGIFSFLAHSAWAQSNKEDLCPFKVLDSGTVEGIFFASYCGNGLLNCHVYIILDSGEKLVLFYGELVDERYFGESGDRVSVDYEIIQYWHPMQEFCVRSELLKTNEERDVPDVPDEERVAPEELFVPKVRIIAKGAGLDIVKKERERMAKEQAENEAGWEE